MSKRKKSDAHQIEMLASELAEIVTTTGPVEPTPGPSVPEKPQEPSEGPKEVVEYDDGIVPLAAVAPVEPEKVAQDAPKQPKKRKKKAPKAASPAPQLPKKPIIRRPSASSFQTRRAWVVTASLEDLREACGQPVELVTIDANSEDARGRIHVKVVEPIHQERYHREPGDLLCRIHREDTKRYRELLPIEEEDAEADCEYCLRKPPRIERRRHQAEMLAEYAAVVKPKEKKKKTKKKKARKAKKDQAHV